MGDDERLVAGRYAVVGELGRGGIGVVWRAEDRVIGRQVALKEIRVPPGLSAGERATVTERVLREARTAGRLNDPAIVTVYDVVPGEDAMFLVMELVAAPTLANVVARRGPLPPAQVAEIGRQVLAALETAHAAGVVHRDVKPSNIMLLPDGRVKLADFGIARAMDDPALTATGGVMGSPGYLAPELFAGAAPTPAGDLWSLGATLFHLVEGRAPFQRDSTAATIHAIMYSHPTPAHCAPPLADVLTGLLTQAPERRLTATGMRALLAGTTTVISADDRPTEVLPPVTDDPDRTALVARRRRHTRPMAGGNTAEPPLAGPPDRLPWADEWPPPCRGRRRALLVAGVVVVALAMAGVAVALIGNRSKTVAAPPGRHVVAVQRTATIPTPQPVRRPTTPAPSVSVTPVPLTTAPAGPAASRQAGHTTAHHPLPTTVPPPATTRANLPTVPITRYHSPDGFHITLTAGSAVPAGFTDEGPLGYLVRTDVPGTVRLYLCQVTGGKDYFSSVDQSGGCEGQTTVRMLGYIYVTPPSGLESAPLYRCNSGGSHYDTLRSDCEGNGQLEGRSGYVL